MPSSSWAEDEAELPLIQEGEGVARLNVDGPEQHPRVQIKKTLEKRLCHHLMCLETVRVKKQNRCAT